MNPPVTLLAVGTLACLTIPPVVTDAAAPPLSVPFRRVAAPAVVVDVRVNGRGPFPFLVDTGSSHSAIDPALAAALGAPRVAKTLVSTPAGDAWAAVVRLERLTLGPVTASDIQATELSREDIAPGGEAVGVIGRDLLERRTFTLDYGQRRLDWSEVAEGEGDDEQVLPLETGGGVWLARVPHGATSLTLVPDSGAEAMVLFDRGQWRRLSFRTGTNRLQSVTGERTARPGVLAELNVGAVRFVDYPVVVVDGAGVDRAHGDGLLPLHQFDRVTFRPAERLLQLSRSLPAGRLGSETR